MHSAKKPWTKPRVRQFETPEQLLATYRKELPAADVQKLVELAERLQRSAKQSAGETQLRKSAER
jgi:hypothetical protein